ncbi:MAG TPA: hypothetical protein VHF47_12960 [Acidimicrobiales bacterium]|nr:hypothetical protein [Acidimicrobiales bacterium]
MSAVWIAPLVVTAIGLVAVALFARRVADEAAELRRSVVRLGDLRPALVEVRSGIDQLRRR